MTDQDKLIKAIFGTAESKFEVGDRVVLPSWYKKTKRQGWVNEIRGIYPDKGYVFLVKVLRSGKLSEDRQAHVYFSYRSITSLRHIES